MEICVQGRRTLCPLSISLYLHLSGCPSVKLCFCWHHVHATKCLLTFGWAKVNCINAILAFPKIKVLQAITVLFLWRFYMRIDHFSRQYDIIVNMLQEKLPKTKQQELASKIAFLVHPYSKNGYSCKYFNDLFIKVMNITCLFPS